MFGKLLKKVLGRKAGTIADVIVDQALDKATHGVSTAAEKAVSDRKRRRG